MFMSNKLWKKGFFSQKFHKKLWSSGKTRTVTYDNRINIKYVNDMPTVSTTKPTSDANINFPTTSKVAKNE